MILWWFLVALRLLPVGVAWAEKPSLATWVWVFPDLACQAPVLDGLRALGIDRIYTTFPVTNGDLEESPVQRFVEAARAVGITVWAVEGDPEAVRPEGREPFIARTRAIVRSAPNVWQEAKVSPGGIQYDIEPYGLPEYRGTKNWHGPYSETLKALHAEVNSLPVEVAVPYWLINEDHGRALLDAMMPYVDILTVMNYRTDIGQLIRYGRPYLDWGEAHNRQVRIAIEMGQLDDPSAAQTSFLGDLAQVQNVVSVLHDAFRSSPAYVGLAVHGLDGQIPCPAPSR